MLSPCAQFFKVSRMIHHIWGYSNGRPKFLIRFYWRFWSWNVSLLLHFDVGITLIVLYLIGDDLIFPRLRIRSMQLLFRRLSLQRIPHRCFLIFDCTAWIITLSLTFKWINFLLHLTYSMLQLILSFLCYLEF